MPALRARMVFKKDYHLTRHEKKKSTVNNDLLSQIEQPKKEMRGLLSWRSSDYSNNTQTIKSNMSKCRISRLKSRMDSPLVPTTFK
jgi:hypothetical protein